MNFLQIQHVICIEELLSRIEVLKHGVLVIKRLSILEVIIFHSTKDEISYSKCSLDEQVHQMHPHQTWNPYHCTTHNDKERTRKNQLNWSNKDGVGIDVTNP
jgi:hypothetical protein